MQQVPTPSFIWKGVFFFYPLFEKGGSIKRRKIFKATNAIDMRSLEHHTLHKYLLTFKLQMNERWPTESTHILGLITYGTQKSIYSFTGNQE